MNLAPETLARTITGRLDPRRVADYLETTFGESLRAAGVDWQSAEHAWLEARITRAVIDALRDEVAA